MAEMQRFDRFKTEWLLIKELFPHPKLQRPFKEKWAKEIADNFDPDLFTALECVPHGLNKYWVLGGQHRLWAARTVLGDDQRLPCHLHESLPMKRQAQITLGAEEVLSWNRLDRWALQIIAEEEVPLKIAAVLTRHQLVVGKGKSEGIVRAIAALENAYRQGGEAGLNRTLAIIYTAWQRDADAYDGVIISGVGLIVGHFDAKVDDEDLGRRIGRMTDPRRLIGQARGVAHDHGTSTARAVAEIMLRAYNKGRRGGKLAF